MIHKHQQYDLLGKMVFERVIFTPPLRLTDQLDSEACLLYSVNGKSTLYESNKKYDITSETGVLMKCGNYFNHWQITKGDSKNEAVAIHLYPDLIRYVYQNKIPDFLTSKKVSKPISIQVLNQSKFLKPYIESLLVYFNNPEILDEEILILKVKELLNLLYKTNSNNIRSLLHQMFTPIDVDFKNCITNNLYEDLSLEELAHLNNLSLSSFKRKFKTIFKDSPAAYIKNKRLEKAKQLLKISNDRIADICFECGFNNVDNFSKSFKKKFGYTPTDFRKTT